MQSLNTVDVVPVSHRIVFDGPVALTRRMLVIAALCFAPPANGAEITVGFGGTIIRLSRPINLGDEKVFEARAPLDAIWHRGLRSGVLGDVLGFVNGPCPIPALQLIGLRRVNRAKRGVRRLKRNGLRRRKRVRQRVSVRTRRV